MNNVQVLTHSQDVTGTDNSQWGMLKALGKTENHLLSIVGNNFTEKVPDVEAPTYGVLIELYHISQSIASEIKRRPNRLLKLFVDTLFPASTVTRADRLERKIRGLCTSYSSLPPKQKVLFLQKQWKPQPTGNNNLRCILKVPGFCPQTDFTGSYMYM